MSVSKPGDRCYSNTLAFVNIVGVFGMQFINPFPLRWLKIGDPAGPTRTPAPATLNMLQLWAKMGMVCRN